MDASALLSQGEEFLREFRAVFEELPEECSVKQDASPPVGMEGVTISNWMGFLDHVLKDGPPSDSKSPAFSMEVYGLPDEISDANIRIESVTTQPSFFGNYPAPDDLDGQTIDLVATHNPPTAMQMLRIAPRRLNVQEDLATYVEVRELQRSRNDRTTLGSIGLLPLEIGSCRAGNGLALRWCDIQAMGCPEDVSIMKAAEQKVSLSDHMPVAFDLRIEPNKLAKNDVEVEQHTLSVMSMNMLAYEYLPFSFWNSEPQGELRDVWLLASRLRFAADRKTKLLPSVYRDMCRTNISDEELRTAGDTPMLQWERLNRKFFAWIGVLQKQAFQEQVKRNPFAPDKVRMGMLARLLLESGEDDRPDLIFLQEVGLEELCVDDFKDFSASRFSQKLATAYPDLEPLLKCYQVVNASPKLNIRRGALPQVTDNGLILARISLLDAFSFEPITHVVEEQSEGLKEVYKENAGKPIVGVRIRDRTGQGLANVFSGHFEKGKTLKILQEMIRISSDGTVPSVFAGDFNAVLKSSSGV